MEDLSIDRNIHMLEIFYPQNIVEETSILQNLKSFGINYFLGDTSLEWNCFLDYVWLTKQMDLFMENKDPHNLLFLDVGCGKSSFHNFIENRYGVFVLGIDRPEGFCHQDELCNVNYMGDFLDMKGLPENSVDVIFWLSSIEHNEYPKIKQLFEKSLRLLKPGGLFLATVPVADKRGWFDSSQQTNLSVDDCKRIFEVEQIHGDLVTAKAQFRENILYLKEKYQTRFGSFDENAPEYVIGGIRVQKEIINHQSLESVSTKPLILFIPSNDTHTHWMLPISQRIDNYQFMVFPLRHENADVALRKENHDYYQYAPGLLRYLSPDLIVLGNDWGTDELDVILESQVLGIPTICIQEGPLLFSPVKGQLQNADYAFLQGEVMKKYVGNQKVVVTGNPKYDEYVKTQLPSLPRVMINCNFTYGIFEEKRNSWIEDVVQACQKLGLEYFISQHPRDYGELPAKYPVIKSNAYKVKEQLEQSSILISRFSTLIYEGLLLGRQVIYYNSMPEPFPLFQTDNNGALLCAENFDELTIALKNAINMTPDPILLDDYLNLHCNGAHQKAVETCAREIYTIVGEGKKNSKVIGWKTQHYYERAVKLIKLNQEMVADRDRLWQEVQMWQDDNQKKVEELNRLTNALQEMTADRDRLWQEVLMWHNDTQKKEEELDKLTNHLQVMTADRDRLWREVLMWHDEAQKKDESLLAYTKLLQDFDIIRGERDSIESSRDDILRERNAVQQELDRIQRTRMFRLIRYYQKSRLIQYMTRIYKRLIIKSF